MDKENREKLKVLIEEELGAELQLKYDRITLIGLNSYSLKSYQINSRHTNFKENLTEFINKFQKERIIKQDEIIRNFVHTSNENPYFKSKNEISIVWSKNVNKIEPKEKKKLKLKLEDVTIRYTRKISTNHDADVITTIHPDKGEIIIQVLNPNFSDLSAI